MFKEIIDGYSGSKLICDTTKLTSVPRNIFHVPSDKYAIVNELFMWENNKYFVCFVLIVLGIQWSIAVSCDVCYINNIIN